MNPFRFKILLLVAVMATLFFSFGNAQACSSVMHYAQNISPQHMVEAAASIAIVPLATFVKDNCTISPTELTSLALKYGKLKILTVVIEAPVYDDNGNLTDKGEFYSYAIKRPDPGHVRMLMDFAQKGEIDKYINGFIKNLVVAGDTEALEKDGLVYLGFSAEVDNFLKPYESFLANA